MVAINKLAFQPLDEPSLRVDRYAMDQRRYLADLYRQQKRKTLPDHTASTLEEWETTTRYLKWEGILTEEMPLWDSHMLKEVGTLTGFQK